MYNGSLGDTIRGVGEAAVSHLYLSVSKSGQWWSVDSSHFKIGKLTASATVDISEKFSVAEFWEKRARPARGQRQGAAFVVENKCSVCRARKIFGVFGYFRVSRLLGENFLSDAESSRGRFRFYSGEAVFPIKISKRAWKT